MPGIVGLISKSPRDHAEAELLRMVDSLRHESFYVTGTWIDESLGVYVGWVARKSPTSDQMPLRSATGETVLVFSGEEFSSPESVDYLKDRGHAQDTRGPAYLVHRAEESPSFLSDLNGRFHGLLASRTTNRITLFNDRYGMHRVYYHEGKDAFYFAAEAKAILAVRPELRSIDTKGMAELVTCGCVLNNRTVFNGIQVLPPASEWVFKNAAIVSKGAYFEPKEWEEQEALGEESYYQQLKDVFSRNLPRYFSGPERIGVSLTGGLDSRMIMAWHKAAPQSLPCYSFGGMFRDCQDVVMARRVAQVCQQHHQVIPVGQEFLAQFPHYSERTVYLTDGCSDVSHASDLYINEIARGIAPVRMTGNYGGEVLRSVRAFKPIPPPPGLFRADISPYIEEAKQTYSDLVHCHPLSFAVFRQAPWHHYSLQALEQTQIALRSPYLDNDFVRTVFRAPKSTLSSNDISLRLIADGSEALRRIRTDRGLGGNYGGGRSAILHNYLEFTFKAEYAYDYGMPQWVARIDHTFSRFHLERLFLGRHKFYHFRVWYRDALSSYVREMLLDSRTLSRPYLEPKTVEAMVNGHLRGDHNYTTAIHKMLTLEHLHRLFIDSK
jgi:asparagine synthase (glutamine-hydrolysing)